MFAKSEGAKVMAGSADICSSMGGSFSNKGNLGFRLVDLRFWDFFDIPSFDFFLDDFLVFALDGESFIRPDDELKLSPRLYDVESSCWQKNRRVRISLKDEKRFVSGSQTSIQQHWPLIKLGKCGTLQFDILPPFPSCPSLMEVESYFAGLHSTRCWEKTVARCVFRFFSSLC